MKKIILFMFALLLTISLVACGNKSETSNVEEKKNTNTKVSNFADSYAKYVEAKSDVFDKLNENIPEGSYQMATALLGFSTIDVALIPITMCGLEEDERLGFQFLYQSLKYESTNDTCKITFNNEGKKAVYESLFDSKTDSIRTMMYEDDKLVIINEYVSLNDGYASQQYYVGDEESTVFRAIFKDDYLAIGYFENVNSEPESIYKNKNKGTVDWTKGGVRWAEYNKGEITSIPEKEI